jgi:hypothetical protein
VDRQRRVSDLLKTKNPALAGLCISIVVASLLQIELNPLFDRMILARQRRNRRVMSVQPRRIESLSKHRNILRLHKLRLHRLSEHVRLAPTPHFLSTRILHHELVRLPRGKTQLDHLRRVVANRKIEFDKFTRVHGKFRAQFCLAVSPYRSFREGRLVRCGSARKGDDGCGTQQWNNQTICHHERATSALGNGNITNFSGDRQSTYQH